MKLCHTLKMTLKKLHYNYKVLQSRKYFHLTTQQNPGQGFLTPQQTFFQLLFTVVAHA